MRRWLAAFLLTCLSGCTIHEPYSVATIPIGEVIAIDGYPAVQRNARPYILDQQSILYEGDILETDNISALSVLLANDMTIETVHSSHQLRIGPHSQNQQTLTLTRGAAAISIGPNAELQLNTSLAKITVSGGKIWAGYEEDSITLQVVKLGYSEVVVENDDGKVVLSAPFDGTTVKASAAPLPVVRWSERKLRSIRSNFSPNWR